VTSYTLFSQSLTDRGTGTNDTNAYTLGVQFAVSQSCTLTGWWFWSGSGAVALPAQCVVFDADTQAQVSGSLTSASWSGAAGSGWVFCSFGGSVTLTSGVHYVAAVYYGGGSEWYSDQGTQNYWTTGPGGSGITNGPLSAPNSAGAINGQAVFNAGTGVTFPATSSSGFDFGTDVEVTPSGGTARTATASLTVTPSFTAARTRGTYRTGILTVTPSFSAARTRGRYRTGTLTVTLSFSAARVHGHSRAASLLVAPEFTAGRIAAHVRSASLQAGPAFRAVPSGGAIVVSLLLGTGDTRLNWTASSARNQ
jgi:hypothetical protein